MPAFQHDAKQRLGPGVAHEQPALTGQLRFDARNGGGDGRDGGQIHSLAHAHVQQHLRERRQIAGEITSQAGWRPGPLTRQLPDLIAKLRARHIRVSMFVDPEADPIQWAASIGADRVELYTEPFARAFERSPDEAARVFARYVDAATLAHSLGLGVNAGHDLDLANLVMFRTLPFLDEVSIGHAIVSRALFVGLSTVVREYLQVLARVL